MFAVHFHEGGVAGTAQRGGDISVSLVLTVVHCTSASNGSSSEPTTEFIVRGQSMEYRFHCDAVFIRATYLSFRTLRVTLVMECEF